MCPVDTLTLLNTQNLCLPLYITMCHVDEYIFFLALSFLVHSLLHFKTITISLKVSVLYFTFLRIWYNLTTSNKDSLLSNTNSCERRSLIGSTHKGKCTVSYSVCIKNIVSMHLRYCNYCTLTRWTLRILYVDI